MEDKEYFRKSIKEEVGWLDSGKVRQEVVSAAKEMIRDDPLVEMILLECACLPPYGVAVQEAVGPPVFDFMTMINYVYSTVVKKEYHGTM